MKLCYLVVALAAALFSILYLPAFSVYLLAILLALPVCLYGLSWWSRAHLDITLETEPCPIPPGTEFCCTVHLHNRSRLPLGAVAVTLGARHSITGEFVQTRQLLSLPGRETIQLLFAAAPDHCGLVRFTLVQVRLYDWLRLFSRSIRPHASCCAAILPPIPALEAASAQQSPTLGETTYLPTTEPEEFLGVRDYRQGDRVRDIHWKLSSKQEPPVVRTYGTPIEPPVLVLLVYALDTPHADPAAVADTLFLGVTTLIAALCQTGQKVQLMVAQAHGDTPTTIPLESPQQIPGVLYDLAASPPQQQPSERCAQWVADQDAAYTLGVAQGQVQLWVRANDGTCQTLPLAPQTAAQTIRTLPELAIPEGSGT